MSLTRQEVFQALADGKEIEYKLHANSVYSELGNYNNLMPHDFNDFDWRIKPEPPKWYENIPEHGVLCWINDIDPQHRNLISIITDYDSNSKLRFRRKNLGGWQYATPLTDDEIKQFLRGE